jgi:hypothetical protein
MAKVKTQMDLVAEAWMKFERALYASKGTHTPDGYYVKLWDLECAVDDLRDEMLQAGILDREMLDEDMLQGDD